MIGIAPPIGSKLPFSADFSGNLQGRYDFDLPDFADQGNAMGHITGSISYTGESLSGLVMDAYVAEDTLRRVYQVDGSGLEIKHEADNFIGAAPGTELIGQEGVPGGRYVQGGYVLVNLAFGVSVDRWMAEFFVDNLTDESANVYVDTQNFTPRVVTNRPRTIGVRISADF